MSPCNALITICRVNLQIYICAYVHAHSCTLVHKMLGDRILVMGYMCINHGRQTPWGSRVTPQDPRIFVSAGRLELASNG